jgi:hypothetical protein
VAKQYWHWHKTGTLSLGTAGKCRPFVPFSFTVTLLLAPKRSIAVWVVREILISGCYRQAILYYRFFSARASLWHFHNTRLPYWVRIIIIHFS